MAKETGFTTMAKAVSQKDVPEIGIGMLGYAFMGKAHTNAYKTLPYMIYPPPALPRLRGICGRNAEAVQEAAKRYGYEKAFTDWRAMLEDDSIQLFDNGGPNAIHAEPCIAAAEAGKHVFCEKPLARTLEEARSMLTAVNQAGVKNMVAFNYRFVPALRLAKNLIDEGKLGRIYHFRGAYLQEWTMPNYETPFNWRLDKEAAGSGVLGDLGAHTIDLAHFLIGDIRSVGAVTQIFTPERPTPDGSEMRKIEIEDAFVSTMQFANGAIGTLEATRYAGGHKNYHIIEINGEKGSIRFNQERLNELEVFWVDDEPRDTRGFHAIQVSEPWHPFWEHWWPHGHIIGWEHTFIHEMAHLLDCIVNDNEVGPYGATFEDGYRTAVVCDTILKSATSGQQLLVDYSK